MPEMKIAFLTGYSEKYKEMQNLVGLGKENYCQRWGYNFLADYSKVPSSIGSEKIKFILKYLVDHPEVDWIFWNDCDSLLTNHIIKLESFLNDVYDFVFTTDQTALNTGNFFVKNSKIGRNYLEFILSIMPQYERHPWGEQQAIIETLYTIKQYARIAPQELFNSYQLDLYPQFKKDGAGQWHEGDFLIHFPGIAFSQRIERIKFYMAKVIE